jgi:hypothetical protein
MVLLLHPGMLATFAFILVIALRIWRFAAR